MKIKEEVLSSIYQKFPQHTVMIEELFDSSENFSSLCEDYHDCVKMLTSLADKRNLTKKLSREYLSLKKALEFELKEEVISSNSMYKSSSELPLQ